MILRPAVRVKCVCMPVRRRCHWIFDLDGTLTVAVHDFDELRRELGLPLGAPILETIAALPSAERDHATRRLDALELALARRARPQTGAVAALEALAAQGRRLGLVTRNSEANARATLRAAGLDRFFEPDDVVGREACAPKPSPDGIGRLLARWQADATDAVMVGDYLFDLQAGRAAGTATILFDAAGEYRWSEYADLCIDSLGALTRP